jgi:probable rRNA maturation factor
MISIAIQTSDGETLPAPRDQIRRWVKSTLKTVARNDVELTFMFLDATAARDLNKQFRKKNYATNVLTFNLDEATADIVICLEVVKQEAKEQHKELASHLAHMVVHGTLHAVGFDHELKAEAEAMEAIEVKVLARFGVADPYFEKELLP